MGGHRAGVAAGYGPGQGRFAGGERVLEGGAQQRAQHPVRGVDADVAEQLRGLRHERDQVVRAVREGSVVEDAVGLGDRDGLGAHFDDECLGDRQHRGVGRDAKGAVQEPGEVQAHAR